MSRYGRQAIVFTTLLFCVAGMRALDGPQSRRSQASEEAQKAKADEIADRIFYREAKFVQDLQPYTPLVETYIQNMKGDEQLGKVPSTDKYFLGRLVMKKGIENISFQKNSSSILQKLDGFYKMN